MQHPRTDDALRHACSPKHCARLVSRYRRKSLRAIYGHHVHLIRRSEFAPQHDLVQFAGKVGNRRLRIPVRK
eukprot:6462941-Amphidinium_carterae.1